MEDWDDLREKGASRKFFMQTPFTRGNGFGILCSLIAPQGMLRTRNASCEAQPPKVERETCSLTIEFDDDAERDFGMRQGKTALVLTSLPMDERLHGLESDVYAIGWENAGLVLPSTIAIVNFRCRCLTEKLCTGLLIRVRRGQYSRHRPI